MAAEGLESSEAEVREVVERFLDAIGRHDLDAVAGMFVSEASIASASVTDGQWTSRTQTVSAFLAGLRQQIDPTPYTEPVDDFVVHVDDDRLAFVRADATLVVGGRPRRHNIDYFTLVNVAGGWKFVNASYVSKPFD